MQTAAKTVEGFEDFYALWEPFHEYYDTRASVRRYQGRREFRRTLEAIEADTGMSRAGAREFLMNAARNYLATRSSPNKLPQTADNFLRRRTFLDYTG